VNLLLDTHAFLWWVEGSRVAPEAKTAIVDPDRVVVVSATTVWEIGIKRSAGKLRFDGSIADQVEANGFETLAITAAHAERAGALPPHHRDPFDRMLVAQAQAERLTIVTRDPAFDAYDVRVLAC
jgi:PIN domain nuclease of toxin-antitoxin system